MLDTGETFLTNAEDVGLAYDGKVVDFGGADCGAIALMAPGASFGVLMALILKSVSQTVAGVGAGAGGGVLRPSKGTASGVWESSTSCSIGEAADSDK
eukprot:scaffold91134_cov47-Prasinocladus_malaysianus.AAC.1